MTPLIQFGVLSSLRREDVAAVTCAELEGRGGLGKLVSSGAATATLFYSGGLGRREPSIPRGWDYLAWTGPNGGGADFRIMIGQLRDDVDAVLFEDDVQPVVNACLAMARIAVPAGCGAVSFYDAGDTVGSLYFGRRCGLLRVPASGPNDLGFHGAQALRLPAWLIKRMQRGDFDPPHSGQDVWLGRVLHGLGLMIAGTCPPLVQHVGEDSLCSPGAELTGARAQAATFPGEDFDALGPWPERIDQQGPATGRPRITWCSFHGEHHEGAVSCPRFTT